MSDIVFYLFSLKFRASARTRSVTMMMSRALERDLWPRFIDESSQETSGKKALIER